MTSHPRVGSFALLLAAPLCALAQATPPPPIVPRSNITGFSTIEQRYTYAPPDEGEFVVHLQPGLSFPNEVDIQEPIMCQPTSHAEVTVRYSKSQNKVTLDGNYVGLPYRMSYTRPRDVSTPYNQFPVSVQNGKWQTWFVTAMFGELNTNFYYDSHTLQLIGSEDDVANPPADAIMIPVPTLQMVCTDIYEGTPEGNATIHAEYAYDQILDGMGTGGVHVAFLPFNLCQPDHYGIYYTKPLSPSKASSFDTVLDSIHRGYGMAFSQSLEPDPKPEYLMSRDNTMVGWGGLYPAEIPAGYDSNPADGTLQIREQCQTHVQRDWPSAYYNICGG